MTDKMLEAMRIIDEAADEAGGYVADPSTLKPNPEGEQLFHAFRMYYLEHKLSLSKMTQEEINELIDKLKKELGVRSELT